MFITVITDCKSENDKARQFTRYATMFNCPISIVGVDSHLTHDATIEAAGNLVDTLDAALGQAGIVVANVAPRGEIKQKWHNGTPFCYFYVGKTLVISTVEGYILSLVKKLQLTTEINLLKLEDVLAKAQKLGLVDTQLADHITRTQFRSFEFIPRLAKWLDEGLELPASKTGLEQIADVPECVWYIDAFGNIKTTLTNQQYKLTPGELVKTNLGEFKYYERLKDLPLGEFGLYPGSSGYQQLRFLELAKQRGDGNAQLQLHVGSEVKILV